MIQFYEELVKGIPLLKDLSEQGDAESLEVLFKNVSLPSYNYLHVSNAVFFSCARDLTWPGLTTPAILNLLLSAEWLKHLAPLIHLCKFGQRMNVTSPMSILASCYALPNTHGMTQCKLSRHSLHHYYSMVCFWIEYMLVSMMGTAITV
jgi:hypothetical protein